MSDKNEKVHVNGTIARIRVEEGSLTSWPVAEKVTRGWQSGVMFYPDEKVTEVLTTYVRAGKVTKRFRAEAQREVLAWLHERGVNAEQLDMAVERFMEPHGLTLEWSK